MKVKIMEETILWELEDRVNEYLSNINCSDVLDIKYSGSGCYAPHGTECYSAMIILRE